MQLKFIGTRGNITRRNKRHYNHSSLLVSHKGTKILIDCGADWLNAVRDSKLNPHAIFITHAHPDHAAGLREGAPCPVFATQASWRIMKHYPIQERELVTPRQILSIGSLSVEAFVVEHSLNAPAVGYRVTSERAAFFYVPDLICIKQQKQALEGIDLYIGDGAIIKRTLLERTRDHTQIGHTPIVKQLQWCAHEQVKRVIITHCGSEIVKHDETQMCALIAALGKQYGVKASLAHDGMIVRL